MHKIAAADWRYVSLHGVVFKQMWFARCRLDMKKIPPTGLLRAPFRFFD